IGGGLRHIAEAWAGADGELVEEVAVQAVVDRWRGVIGGGVDGDGALLQAARRVRRQKQQGLGEGPLRQMESTVITGNFKIDREAVGGRGEARDLRRVEGSAVRVPGEPTGGAAVTAVVDDAGAAGDVLERRVVGGAGAAVLRREREARGGAAGADVLL